MMKKISTSANLNSFSCPVPIAEYKNILLAHGAGGKLTQQLIQKMFLPQFQNEYLQQLHDGATFSIQKQKISFTTDSYVVEPIFFPGGDIGKLAINGTVNDLAMCGAVPMYLSVAFIIEEGLPVEDLWRIICSMKDAAERANVQCITGDTKVVDRGKGDKIFITTSGIGIVDKDVNIDPCSAQIGDHILISGTIADHGIAILSVREGLEFETQLISDTAPLHELVQSMLSVDKAIRVLRDPTRGGLATALNEIAKSSRVGISIQEDSIPIKEEVTAACEILGIDPLYVANEGKLIAIVSTNNSARILEAMRSHPLGKDSACIGTVVPDHPGMVMMKNKIGATRIVDMIAGEQLPRIC